MEAKSRAAARVASAARSVRRAEPWFTWGRAPLPKVGRLLPKAAGASGRDPQRFSGVELARPLLNAAGASERRRDATVVQPSAVVVREAALIVAW